MVKVCEVRDILLILRFHGDTLFPVSQQDRSSLPPPYL